MIYTITLSPAIDYFMEFDNKISNHQKTDKYDLLAGGKGINASILLNNIGIKTEAIIVTGGDIGQKLMNNIKKHKFKCINIETNAETRINVKANFGGETYELNTTGRKVNPSKINKELLSIIDKKVKKDDVVMIMGGFPPGYKIGDLEKVVKVLCDKKVKLVFDLSQDHLLHLAKYKPEIIKPNKKELSEMFDVNISSKDDAFKYATKLLDMGAKRVLVSFDKSGSIYVDKENRFEIEGVVIKEVNGSGAGDSMIAGFTAGLSKNYSIKDSLKLASASGTATAASEGIATKDKVESFINKIKVKGEKNV